MDQICVIFLLINFIKIKPTDTYDSFTSVSFFFFMNNSFSKLDVKVKKKL